MRAWQTNEYGPNRDEAIARLETCLKEAQTQLRHVLRSFRYGLPGPLSYYWPASAERSKNKKANVTTDYVSMLEAGKRKSPSRSVLQRLAKALGVPVTELLG